MTVSPAVSWHDVLMKADITFDLRPAMRDHPNEIRSAFRLLTEEERPTAYARLNAAVMCAGMSEHDCDKAARAFLAG